MTATGTSTTEPIVCQATTVTASSVSGTCFLAQTTAIAVGGTANPFATVSGATVMIVAREPTQ